MPSLLPFRLRNIARAFIGDRRGAVAVEYGVLLLMVAVAMLGIGTLANVADGQNAAFNSISDALVGTAD